MNDSKIEKLSKKINDFYKTKMIIIIFMTITTIFGIFQVTLFATNKISINGTFINDNNNKLVLLAWIATLISLISCYTGFIGAIQNVKKSNSFLIWMTIQLIMLSIVAFMAGALFTSISSITGLILTFVRYFVWKNNLTEKWNLSKRKVLILSIIILISLLIIFNLVVYFFSNNSSFWDDNEKNKWLWYFDAIGASLEICAYTFLIFKVWWAFLFFFTSKFFFGTIYGMTGNYISLVQMLLFATVDISGILGWFFNYKES